MNPTPSNRQITTGTKLRFFGGGTGGGGESAGGGVVFLPQLVQKLSPCPVAAPQKGQKDMLFSLITWLVNGNQGKCSFTQFYLCAVGKDCRIKDFFTINKGAVG